MSTIALAGCSQGILGPDPQIMDTEGTLTAGGITSGAVTIAVLVRNKGQGGDCDVTLRQLNGDTVVDKTTKTVNINGGEDRRVNFNVSVLSSADSYDVKASASGFL
jgi:hypothetical protein